MSIMAEQHGKGWAGAFDQARSYLVDLPEPADDDRPLFARIAEVIAQAIEARTFGQGMRLPPAASIAHRYATSVDTGRAAVRVLVEQGLVTREPGGGAYVRGAAVPRRP